MSAASLERLFLCRGSRTQWSWEWSESSARAKSRSPALPSGLRDMPDTHV